MSAHSASSIHFVAIIGPLQVDGISHVFHMLNIFVHYCTVDYLNYWRWGGRYGVACLPGSDHFWSLMKYSHTAKSCLVAVKVTTVAISQFS